VVRQGVARRIAVRFHAEAAARQGRDEMRVQLGRGVRRDHDRVLLGQRGDAQALGETRSARAVELHVADRAGGDEVAHREAGELALAVREGYRGGGGQPHEIRRLQIPVQRLFQPVDVERLDPAGELDAAVDVVRRVHVEHQGDVLADGLAHRPHPPRLVRRAAGAGLELDGAIPGLHEACELLGIDRVRRSGTVVASRRVGRNRALLASQHPPDRQARVLALDVPERDVDAPDRRHDLRPLAARQWRRQAVSSGDASGARAREGEEPVPHRDMGERVHAADDLSEPFHPGADRLHRRAVDLPVAGEAVVGAHFHHDNARRCQFLVCRPDWIVQRHRDRMGLDAGDPGHVGSRFRPGIAPQLYAMLLPLKTLKAAA
jgi:hypothetical protein